MFFGIDSMVWWFGVVEDRIDPLKLGRVRVRLWVHHCKEKTLNQKTGNGILTEDLPWAYVGAATSSPSMDGIGITPLIVEGSSVYGFSRDGNTLNDLVVVGTVPGMPEDAPNPKIGYFDPRTPGELAESPNYRTMENYPKSDWLKKTSLNRLHTVTDLHLTYLEDKKKLRKTGIKNVLGGWDELPSSYGAKYPYNQVYMSEAGHVVEFDDTKQNERYGFWHGAENKNKGSYFEFFPDGSYVLKAKLEMQILADSFNLYSKGLMRMSTDSSVGISATQTINLQAGLGLNVIVNSGLVSITNLAGIVNVASTIAVNVEAPTINLVTKLLTINTIPFYVA